MTNEELSEKIETRTATLEDAKAWACEKLERIWGSLAEGGAAPSGLFLYWSFDNKGRMGALSSRCAVPLNDHASICINDIVKQLISNGTPANLAVLMVHEIAMDVAGLHSK